MNNTDINYKDFIKYVHQHFDTDISLNEVEEILHLEEDYNLDNPNSLGKSLMLSRLIFSGQKVSGQKIYHDQNLYKGINLWIADNHKGKSSIFKIIKFALTGENKVKSDINPWIHEIILEFNIGQVIYTIYVDKKGRDKGALFSFGIDKFLDLRKNQKLETIEAEKEFDFKTNIQFCDRIQEFFFEQFSFYTLKYTQKNSAKDNFELSTAHLTWLTYFKSIYLESRNYEYLFFEKENMGAQGRKIFEMILGLPLTYPINMLRLQSDKVSEKIGKLNLVDKTNTETSKSRKIKLNKRFNEVKAILSEIQDSGVINFNEKPLIKEYNSIQSSININHKETRIVTGSYQVEKNKATLLDEEIHNLIRDKDKVEIEVNRLTKQMLNVEVYKEAESFFSNLDIKTCPHCEIEVNKNKKHRERESHVCCLCGEKSTQQKIDVEELQNKLFQIKEEISGHKKKMTEIEKVIEIQNVNKENLRQTVVNLYSKLVSIPSLDIENNRLKEIEAQIERINIKRTEQYNLIEKKNNLLKEEAVLSYQLQEIEKMKSADNTDELSALCLKNEILDFARQALEKKRIKLNKNILSKLEKLILEEVHAFGLISIDKIEISEKYNLIFTQNQVCVNFNDLNEGEKLRVKLAFYLSLIQLDIEYKLGRHPRFLIFDSPGSEEMVPKHLNGLSDIFKEVNERFKDHLQIFVGSALREFSDITDKKRTFIKEEEEFVF